MINPNFKTKSENVQGNSAEIHIEPLENGFGHTLGNALRRVLLTNLEGAAPTSIQIDGVRHQFSTMSGLQQNIIELILGLKGVYFKLEDDKPAVVKIDAKGKKTLKASDLICPAGVSVANPDHVIAELTDDKSKVKATITIESGVGYVTADEHEVSEIGVIPVDSIFTPVLKANYSVEATRVGRRTDLDKIIMNITTNGTITPEEAVNKAARILTQYFTQIYEPVFLNEDQAESSVSLTGEPQVEELELPTRVTNALKKGGFKKLADFKTASMDDLLKIKNLGEKSVEDIIKRLAKKGIEIK